MDELTRRIEAKTGVSVQIAQAIRLLILKGELAPGERIVESRFARQLRVGQPTVREALTELEHQGLVLRKANRGCYVTALSEREIADALALRGELEMLAVELACTHASDAELHELMFVAKAMLDAAHAGDGTAFCECDRHFHEILWRASGNTCMPKVLAQVMLPLLAFLFIRHAHTTGAIDLERSAQAHIELVGAIQSREARRAHEVARRALASFSLQHLRQSEAGA